MIRPYGRPNGNPIPNNPVPSAAIATSHHNRALGQCIGIRLDIDHLVVFRRSGGGGDGQEGHKVGA